MTRRRRATRARVGWPVLLLALVLSFFGLAATPAAAQTSTSPTAPVTASLVSISPQVRTGEPLSIELQATGTVPTDAVRVVIMDRALDGGARAALRKIVDGTETPRATQYNPITGQVKDLTDPTRATLKFAITNDRLPQTPGVYPLQITVGTGSRASKPITTWLVRVGAPATGDVPFTVSFVVPVRSAIADQPDGTTVIGAAEVKRLDDLATVVESAPTGSMTVVPNPETLDALGSSDAAANAALEHLKRATATNSVLAEPYVPLDIDAWRRAGRDDYVSLMLREGRDTLTRTLGRPATDISSRTAVLGSRDTTASLESLRREGAVNAVVPDVQLEGLRTESFPSPFSQTFRIRDSGNQDVLAASADGWLANAVVQLSRSADQPAKAQQILADLAAAYFDRTTTPRGSVVLLPDDWAPVADVLAKLLFTPLSTSSVVQLRNIDGFFSTVSRSHPDNEREMETLVSGPMRRTLNVNRGPDVDSLARDLDSARAALASYESIFGEGLTALRTTQFDKLLLASSDERLTEAQHRAYIEAATSFVTQSIRTPTGKVGISAPESERFTLTSRHEKIRLVLDNELAAPATVRIDLRSEKLTFPQGDSITTVLQPGSNVVEFDVSVKTSGDSLLEYTVNAPQGSLGELARGKLRVRAWALSGLGVILSVVAILVIVTWWFRHAVRARRTKRALATTPEPEPVPV